MQKKFYITTPIYYVNDKPHVGHAYTNIVSDTIARFKQLDGYKVKFLTGVDEHGQKVEKSAQKYKTKIKLYIDSVAANFMNLTKELNLSNNYFNRTTDISHKSFVQNVWKKLKYNNYIYLGKYSGWYSIKDESFITEPGLVNGQNIIKADIEWVEESSYFFNLKYFQKKLLNFYEKNPNFINPKNKRNEIISFVKSGLKDLSISRTSFQWGIKSPDNKNHIIYVWFDALFNYVSSLNKTELSFWPTNIHIIGKDILIFHAVYWPAILMAINLPIPRKICSHGWWTNDNSKISKSLNNSIYPNKIIKKYNLDYFRYYLLKEIKLGNDGNFLESNLIKRVNSELVNKIGNLIFRVKNLVYKHFYKRNLYPYAFYIKDIKLLSDNYKYVIKIRKQINNQALKKVLETVIQISSNSNLYLNQESPWKIAKQDFDRVSTILYIVTESIRIITILIQSFMPDVSKLILDYLNIKQKKINSISRLHCIYLRKNINKPVIFFKKIK